MKKEKQHASVCLTSHGIDEASETVAAWLEHAGVDRRGILHSRMVLEELLLSVSAVCGETTSAEISFAHSRLLIRYAGKRFNPVQHAQNEMETVSNENLSRA